MVPWSFQNSRQHLFHQVVVFSPTKNVADSDLIRHSCNTLDEEGHGSLDFSLFSSPKHEGIF